jgi:hypothetical protein
MILSSLSIRTVTVNTGGWCNRTASVNIIYTDEPATSTASKNKFPLMVSKSGPLVFISLWRAVAETAIDNL